MVICNYYDNIAEYVFGISFNEIVASEAHRDYIMGLEFTEYVESRYYFMRDYINAFESIADYLQESDLYAYCLESAEIEIDSFLGSIIAGLKPLDLLAYYKRLCKLNRGRGYYNDEIEHLRSLPILEHFIIVCEKQAFKYWKMEIESIADNLEYLEIAK